MATANELKPTFLESAISGVSWGAVLAGAFVAAAVSLALVLLGAGLGLSAVSPWANTGASAAKLGVAAIVWLILMQIISASLGAYVAGRLRTRWSGLHNDEVYFRDTAHGFLVWAVGLVLTAAFLTSAATSLVGTGVKAGATAAAALGTTASTAATPAATEGSPITYLVDSLFRADKPDMNADSAATRAEAARILAANLLASDNREFDPADKTYLARLIVARTGLSEAEAEKRVAGVQTEVRNAEAEARQAADTVRKAAAHTSLWVFLSLLAGAFCASFAATLGGRQRDNV